VSRFITHFDAVPWKENQPGVRHKSVVERGLKLRIVEFSGDYVEPEWCLAGHMGYVLEGEMEIVFDDGETRIGVGDAIHIPGGEDSRHKARALTPRVRMVTVEDA
jgi:quercetin dioxygenase-like cupin family protein